jgi:hypothetical protein
MVGRQGANLTREHQLAGAHASKLARRTELRLRKKALAIEERAELFSLVKSAMQSPVMAGVAAYFIVDAVQSASASYLASQQSGFGTGPNATGQAGALSSQIAALSASVGTPNAGNVPGTPGNVLSGFLSFFSGLQKMNAQVESNVAGAVSGAAGSTLSAIESAAGALGGLLTGDFDALKLAIILYVASGGNLAGLLTSAGGLLSGIVKGGLTLGASAGA